MSIARLGGILALWTMVGAGGAFGQDSEADKRAVKLFSEQILTDDFPDAIPLGKFLQALEAKMSADNKMRLKFDEEAFGKNATKLLATSVKLPAYPKRMTVGTALRIGLSKLDVPRIEMRPYATHLAITTPERASYTATYDFREVIRDALPKLKGVQEIPAGEEKQWLFDHLADSIEFSSLEIRNGTQVVLHTTWQYHMAVPGVKAMVMRLTDVAVVMQARLYEVEQDFFDKNVTPLLVDPRDKVTKKAWARASPDIVKSLAKQTKILDGDDGKFSLKQSGLFLAHQTGTRYLKEAAPEEGASFMGMGWSPSHALALHGVVLQVRPEVSSDRRRIKLAVTQTVTELAGINKVKVADPKTRKEAEVESPNLRKSTSAVEMVIWDGQPIVLPVAYRSAAARAKNRQWVVLARPIVYIEEEEEQLRKQNLPKADLPEKPIELPKKGKAPERTEKNEQILHAIVRDVLTNQLKELQVDPLFPVDRSFVLDDDTRFSWPAWFEPGVRGYRWHVESDEEVELNLPRRIMIRIDHFAPDAKNADDAKIEVSCTFGYLGGLHLTYRPKRDGNRWTVECSLAQAP